MVAFKAGGLAKLEADLEAHVAARDYRGWWHG